MSKPRIFNIRFAVFLLLPLLACSLLSAQTVDDEDYPPGLLARYTAGKKTVERIDADVSFVWGSDAPDVRLPAGPFQAEWTGVLLVKQKANYRFHAYVEGHVRIEIDGLRVLEAGRKHVGWVSGDAVPLDFGDKKLRVVFKKSEPAARLNLFWSSDLFQIEPIPTHRLFREEPSARLGKIERGRLAFAAHRCNRCHRREEDSLSPPAPALAEWTSGLSRDWMMRQIQNPQDTSPHARMPSFGFSSDEARAVVAFLRSKEKTTKLDRLPPAVKPKATVKPKNVNKPALPTDAQERRAGEVLLRSVGCLACHRVGKHGNNGAYGGGDLSGVGRKRSAEWFYTWLGRPEVLNPDHHMPLVKTNQNERRLLALYLASLKGDENSASDAPQINQNAALIVEGRRLVKSARCAACHRIDSLKADVACIPSLAEPVADWTKSCLSKHADVKNRRPAYTGLDREAMTAYVKSRSGTLSPVGLFARGRHLLEQKNCLACHARDGAKGIVAVAGKMSRIDEAHAGQSQLLIPPNLTAVGDKLHDHVLADAIRGEQKPARLPWLRVRMPKFKHSKPESDALLAYMIGHDRIPDHPPEGHKPKPLPKKTDGQTLVAVRSLVGAKGFSCIGCHAFGSYSPRNVAMGTRGSNLLMPGKRMRRSFYLRWTRSPLRIVPGMEMPSYTKPLPGILGGDIDRQLAATWDALNDPRFKAPTNPSVVEQLMVVKPGGPARVVRDVFTVPGDGKSGENGEYVARALAVGFSNGHSLLFDLDRYCVRGWTFGDFARQRAVGKSWYWDLAGVPLTTDFPQTPNLALRRFGEASSKLIFPQSRHGSVGRLLVYNRDGDGVRFRYNLRFEIDGESTIVRVGEQVKPIPASVNTKRSGWKRTVVVDALPEGHDLYIARPKTMRGLGAPTIEAVSKHSPRWITFSEQAKDEFTRLEKGTGVSPRARRGVTLHYLNGLIPEPIEVHPLLPQKPRALEKVTSLPGFDGVRLPFDRSIMPTAITWMKDGTLAFTSLKGHVYLAHDTNGDGIEDRLTLFEEGLSSPFGIIADGNDLIVAHKPELLRLRDTNGDGRADQRTVVATGWGFTDNYHDWTTGIVRDSDGNLYVGLGSDYNQRQRPKNNARWRGKVLRIDPAGSITPVGHSFRYPTGLAIDAENRIFVTDNQGVQNAFNEINHLIVGRHYGVPSRYEKNRGIKATPPAIQVPHPWTRSVNGLFFLPPDPATSPLAGHGIGCEYDSRFLIRFTTESLGGVMQGATYYFSRPNAGTGRDNFLGPLCGAVSPSGEIYIGSIHDSGWQGGANTGEIVRLKPNGNRPNGIRELRTTPDGFEIEFFDKVNASAASATENYNISGYTRVWKGGYATPDSGRHKATVRAVDVRPDARTVTLHVDGLREGYVYEVTCGNIGAPAYPQLFPTTGHYTLHRKPKSN